MARFGGGSVGHSAATMAVPLTIRAPCQRTESRARTLEVKFGARRLLAGSKLAQSQKSYYRVVRLK
jgi:hypothetical protein